MRLAALTAGFGIPTGVFRGSVVAIHPRACVLASRTEYFVTLVVHTVGSLPFGITLDAPLTFHFADSVAIGAGIAARGGILRFTGSSLSVDLRGALPWRSRLSDHTIDLGKRSVRKAWEVAMTALQEDGRGAPLGRLAGASIDMLVDATRACDIAASSEVFSNLVGLGEGATPAGDDYLVGHFAALWSGVRGDESCASFVFRLGTRLKQFAARTHRISRVYLEAAADGEVSERLAKLAAQIAAGATPRTVKVTVAAALAVGHSSGANGIMGLLLGSAAWGPGAVASVSRVLATKQEIILKLGAS
jgi:Protein of unknown function (DUF2877).